MNNPGYYRRASGSRRPRGREEGDAVATALTMQVILVVILVLVAVIAKKTDEVRFGELKAQYRIMATDPAESEKVWNLFSGGGLQRFFTELEEFVTSALAGLGGDEALVEAETEPTQSTEMLQPPQPELEIVTEPTIASEPIPAFSLSAPEPETLAYFAEARQDEMLPEVMSYTQEEQPVPEDCTMAPVVLRGKLQPPVTGVITSGFAYREHPVTGRSDFHNGMDIAAGAGNTVLAAMPGQVAETGWSDVYGNYVVVRHDDSFATFYGHCAALLAEKGGSVRQGEAIATVGDTGLTTGPHLHFSVIVSDQFTDPYWVLRDSIQQVQ
jgi:murein DD-endopeptidase MepM/ murein hydrolase activator NlpD